MQHPACHQMSLTEQTLAAAHTPIQVHATRLLWWGRSRAELLQHSRLTASSCCARAGLGRGLAAALGCCTADGFTGPHVPEPLPGRGLATCCLLLLLLLLLLLNMLLLLQLLPLLLDALLLLQVLLLQL